MVIGVRGRLAALLVAAMLVAGAAGDAAAQEHFASPEAAAAELVEAAKSRQPAFVERIFGPGSRAILSSGDREEDEKRLQDFVTAADEKVEVAERGEDRRVLVLGRNAWEFPVPLVRGSEGWAFDIAAGREEIENRRIGYNELSAIEACRTYVAAQREYYREDRNADEVQEYAQRILSTPGKRDGLYWPAQDQADRSPLDGRISQSVLARRKTGEPYHGYYFRILKAQGPSAPGGEYDYVINGRMIAGFALVAFPAEWGKSGVMTFICNQQGKVFQRNLGPGTLAKARAMQAYDPDSSWTLVEP